MIRYMYQFDERTGKRLGSVTYETAAQALKQIACFCGNAEVVEVEITVGRVIPLDPKDAQRAELRAKARERIDTLDDTTLAALANGNLIATEPKGGA